MKVPASRGYAVLQWPKMTRSAVSCGGYKGVSAELSRATRYRVFKRLAMRDWGSSPVMVTLTTRKVADALTTSDFAGWWLDWWRSIGQPVAIRLEFQRRKSAHLHGLTTGDVSRETLSALRSAWLEFNGETNDKYSRRHAFHVTHIKAAQERFLMLYCAGHTVKGDYQSVAPYPIRRWFWIHDECLPHLSDCDLIVSRETWQDIADKYIGDRPVSYGGTLVLDINEIVGV